MKSQCTPWSPIHQLAIGKSVENRKIIVHHSGDLEGTRAAPDGTLIIGGMHGDEKATVVLLESFLERFAKPGVLGPAAAILPLANPDAYACHSRYNARGVDINRNCGTNWHVESVEPSGPQSWSEPETVALRDFILLWQPRKIVSLHWALAEIDADGTQSTGLAETMWGVMSKKERGPYRMRVTELGHGMRRLQQTYEICPGSLGQWCGYGLEYPDGSRPAMITLELPYDPAVEQRPDELPAAHLETMHEIWRTDAAGYLRAVEPGVHKMLLAACAFLG